MKVVLDASVIIKWFLDEQLSEKAITLRHQHLEGQITICVPALLVYELVNALCTKAGVDERVITSAINNYYIAQINEITFDQKLMSETAKFSKKYSISAYDAAYIALAKNLDCQFLAADKKLHQRIKGLKGLELFT